MTVNKAAEAISRKLTLRRGGGNGHYIEFDQATCYLPDRTNSSKKLTGSQRRSGGSAVSQSIAFGEDIKCAFFKAALQLDEGQACPAPPALERASTLGSATTTLESVMARRKDRGRLHQELLRHTNATDSNPSDAPDDTDVPASSLMPSSVITVTKSRRNLMRQVSALGMGGALAAGAMSSPKKSPPIFDDMRADAVPGDMQELFSVCSDPTAEPGVGLDATLYRMNLGTRRAVDRSRNPGSREPERGCDHRPSELWCGEDNDTISTCSMDERIRMELKASARTSTFAHSTKSYQYSGGRLSNADGDDDDDDSIDLEGDGDDEESFDVVQQDSRQGQRGSEGHSNNRKARNVKSTVDKMHDSQQLIMEAALACREGTAWCTKSLAHEALEQSFSHLSRASVPRW